MKNIILAATAGAIVATGTFAVPAEAGPFDRLKRKVQKVEREVRKVEQTVREVEDAVDTVEAVADGNVSAEDVAGAVVNGTAGRTRLGSPIRGVRAMNGAVPGGRNYPKTAQRAPNQGVAAPVPAKYVNQLNCANAGLGNAFVGRGGNYTFQKGIKTESRSGIIERRNVSATNGCLMPTLSSGDILYLEVNKAGYNKYGYDLQCVSYDGSEQLNRSTRPPLNNYTGKDVMLHTGHSLGYTPTASGSNSDRAGQYKKALDARGREMLTFNMPELHTDSGTDFFCQHFDEKSGKALVAFAFRRSPSS